MQLERPFYCLPWRFDAQQLTREAAQFAEHEWQPHPQGHRGNDAVPLVALHGDIDNPQTVGPMRPTAFLARCPYIMQIFAALQVPVGRSRLMRIAGREQATLHVDTNYYWSQRVRVHVPIVTYPGVQFLCAGDSVFMDAGEAWIFDTWQPHNVINPDDRPRIHLVIDTVGSAHFWDIVAAVDAARDAAQIPTTLAFAPDATPTIAFESINFPTVMSPWEIRHLIQVVQSRFAPTTDAVPGRATLAQLNQRLLHDWQAAWAQYGTDSSGMPRYEALLRRWDIDTKPWVGTLSLSNGVDPVEALRSWVARAALNPALDTIYQKAAAVAPTTTPSTSPVVSMTTPAAPIPDVYPANNAAAQTVGVIDRPIFIVSSPRSGSSWLFETLAAGAEVYTVGGESHDIIESIPTLTPAHRQFGSNELTAQDATPEVIEQLYRGFWQRLRSAADQPPPPQTAVRFLEKTPKNALRIGFLATAFPTARFIYLHRKPEECLASMIEAWRAGRFITYPQLPGWDGLPWSMLLTPGWRDLVGKSLPEIVAAQWDVANKHIMDALEALPAGSWCAVSYTDLLADPQAHCARLAQFAGWKWKPQPDAATTLSRHTLTPPHPDKWKQHADALAEVLPALAPTAARAQTFSRPAPRSKEIDLRSVHTTSMTVLLRELGASLFVSTYQAGKLIILRAQGDGLNTHFRDFPKPMGLALRNNRLAMGTKLALQEFCDVPAVSRRLKPADVHDACFLPRSTHVTGDIQIHDVAFAEDELWFVNTSFSCLCTRSADYSFEPRWRPPFVTALAPEDRCHLNGLAVRDGKPRYVTALGESDERNGWRARKRDGGIVMDITTNTVIARGLSMPHSPRWYADKLWVLNSGIGGLGTIDLTTGQYQEVARLPGFTRGLDFVGRFALVGLSQVRESATFSGIGIAELPVAERACGVWVVDLTNGKIVAFTKFEGVVQEIFAVQAALGRRFPDVITDDEDVISNSFVLPDAALQAVPAHLRHITR